MSWILGDPFMKSNLVAFYFGNITHPSSDPPRMGFLSTVPTNANELLNSAVSSAQRTGGFIVSSVDAPSATFTPSATNSAGIPTNGVDSTSGRNGAQRSIVFVASVVSLTMLSLLIP
ncbi:hypothetical protein M422DRAFT_786152 [Sphaerobolus stellatus SS14]|uniref:Uncharacterized protein n=1 Tax=Sphaerobolus stellatus (strain SS14) TaxID=990650 RepID=A0A0C9T3S0_SPHS4|nr:hypothetical protein M422DRAFT_786152 [Sphaerobolus stellatus SS14]